MKNIEALIADGGNITLGAIHPIDCAATAADDHNAVAMLVRRNGETLNALLKRLDKAVGQFYDDGDIVDEITPTDSGLAVKMGWLATHTEQAEKKKTPNRLVGRFWL